MGYASDETLLAGLAAGDPEAALSFVRRYQRRVFGLARTILSDPSAAEDVAQETFLRIWRHAGAYDARRGSAGPWVLSIARNLAIDQARMRRTDRSTPQGLIPVEGASGEATPEDRAIVGSEARRLARALRTLPGEQRRAVVLAGFYGRTAREISESEDVPLGTVKTRIRAAMLKLREAMKEESEQRDEPTDL